MKCYQLCYLFFHPAQHGRAVTFLLFFSLPSLGKRAEGISCCAAKRSMFHVTRLGGKEIKIPSDLQELGEDFRHLEQNFRPSDDKALFEGIEIFVD